MISTDPAHSKRGWVRLQSIKMIIPKKSDTNTPKKSASSMRISTVIRLAE